MLESEIYFEIALVDNPCVQTDLKYEFLLNKWLGLDKDDGEVERLVPVTGGDANLGGRGNHDANFLGRFFYTGMRLLKENHLWFSIFVRFCTTSNSSFNYYF